MHKPQNSLHKKKRVKLGNLHHNINPIMAVPTRGEDGQPPTAAKNHQANLCGEWLLAGGLSGKPKESITSGW